MISLKDKDIAIPSSIHPSQSIFNTLKPLFTRPSPSSNPFTPWQAAKSSRPETTTRSGPDNSGDNVKGASEKRAWDDDVTGLCKNAPADSRTPDERRCSPDGTKCIIIRFKVFFPPFRNAKSCAIALEKKNVYLQFFVLMNINGKYSFEIRNCKWLGLFVFIHV